MKRVIFLLAALLLTACEEPVDPVEVDPVAEWGLPGQGTVGLYCLDGVAVLWTTAKGALVRVSEFDDRCMEGLR